MKIQDTPFKPIRGVIGRLAIQCKCPDTGLTGSFLFVAESHLAKGTRVTPLYDDLSELYPAIKEAGWIPVSDPSHPCGAYQYFPGGVRNNIELEVFHRE